MTPKRHAAAVLGAAGVLAAAVWLLAAPGGQDAHPAGAAAPRPTDTTWPLSATPAAPAPATTSGAAAAPPPSPTTPAPRSPATSATAGPFVQTFAQQPGVRPQRPLPSPTATHHVPANVDGCDHNYGTITQCVPWTFPDGTTDRCAWLAGHGFERLRVVGEDRQKLDSDGNKIACDD
ncbi:hypothetical protein ACFQFC_05380 [Amorphoplanes digitatis]|uniref:Excalibur calcium-binding domain-containing protein n=1 Tax=Actinoplanes digitatis TaxID=1868 RepID=A0A7W7HZL8_9ACTN|nr:hypothetical protein [Actinoplanes digitatis]MBB4763623.1 hypothetical protein [Actinoplanes digitatis]GID93119.1 hypothetical protein Adi01nite_25310 [Actinoplanes digitatis]